MSGFGAKEEGGSPIPPSAPSVVRPSPLGLFSQFCIAAVFLHYCYAL
jgi:hypothetical protein